MFHLCLKYESRCNISGILITLYLYSDSAHINVLGAQINVMIRLDILFKYWILIYQILKTIIKENETPI